MCILFTARQVLVKSLRLGIFLYVCTGAHVRVLVCFGLSTLGRKWITLRVQVSLSPPPPVAAWRA